MATFAYTAINKSGKRTSGTLLADTRAGRDQPGDAAGPSSAQDRRAEKRQGRSRHGGGVQDFFRQRCGQAECCCPAAHDGRHVDAARLPEAGRSVYARPGESARRWCATGSGARPLEARGVERERQGPLDCNQRRCGRRHRPGRRDGEVPPRVFHRLRRDGACGEAGGFLDVVLQQIADFRTRETDLKGKVKAALVYPVVLGIFAITVVIFLLTWFIPRFAPIFAQFGGDLPALTKVIVAVSDTIKSYGLFVGLGVVAVIMGIRFMLQTDVGRRRVEQTILAVPVLGRVIAHFALVRFCRMLGTLIGAGVPLVMSLRTAREAIGNQTLADTVSDSIEEVQRGEALSRSLANCPRLFPPSVVETLAVAEETGRLDKELVRIATSFESDLDRQLRMLVAIAEPLLLVMMAGVIGTIVVGMLLPIFNMQDLIK